MSRWNDRKLWGRMVAGTDCPNVASLRKQPERLIEVTWAEGKPTSFVSSQASRARSLGSPKSERPATGEGVGPPGPAGHRRTGWFSTTLMRFHQ